jgi:drug/metabolite transporter (DMT)-like permease
MLFAQFSYSQLLTEDRNIISRYTLIALLFVSALGAVRGSVPAISKIVTLGGINPILYAASISFFGGLLLILVNRVLGSTTPLTMQAVRFSLIGGFVGITIPHIIFFNGIRSVDVGIASAMISGVPIIIYVLSLIFKQETFAIGRFMGVLSGLIGVVMIACAGITEEALVTASFVGIALILLSTIFYASNVVYISLYLPNNLSRMQAAAWMMIFGSLPIWLYIPIGHDLSLISSSAQNPAFMFLLLHCFISGLAYYLSFYIISKYGPVIYSAAAYLMVAFGIFVGVIAFGERYETFDMVGIGLIILGVVAVTMKRNQIGTEPRLDPPQT